MNGRIVYQKLAVRSGEKYTSRKRQMQLVILHNQCNIGEKSCIHAQKQMDKYGKMPLKKITNTGIIKSY